MLHEASITPGRSLFLPMRAIKQAAGRLVVSVERGREGEEVSLCLRGDKDAAKRDRLGGKQSKKDDVEVRK